LSDNLTPTLLIVGSETQGLTSRTEPKCSH